LTKENVMLKTGLVSVTFRKLSPREIVDLVRRAGLDGIEWGGDIHSPHGDLGRAREVRQMTLDAGLRVAAYGSYYRVGHNDPAPFEDALASAVELGAPTVRVWAGKMGSAEASEEYRQAVVADSCRIADLAARERTTVSFEWHRNTLTDTTESAARLLRDVAHPSIRTYWQPPVGSTLEGNLAALDAVLPVLSNVHVYHWAGPGERRPLAEGEREWRAYLRKIGSSADRYALIEFVRDDLPERFMEDAEALKRVQNAECRVQNAE
jgi:sugar phosphate isomerase/epimerase